MYEEHTPKNTHACVLAWQRYITLTVNILLELGTAATLI